MEARAAWHKTVGLFTCMAQVSARAGLSSEILHFIIGLAYKSFCLGKVLESVLISNTYRIGLIMRKLHRNPTSPIPNSGGSWTQDWRLRVLPWVSYTVRRHISSRIIALSEVADVDKGMRTLARLIGGIPIAGYHGYMKWDNKVPCAPLALFRKRIRFRIVAL